MRGRLILRAALGAVVLAALVPTSLSAAPPPDEVYIKGAVTTRLNKPVRAAWVILTQNGEEKGRSLTADDGRYYIGDLSAGEYQVVVKQGPHSIFEGHVRLPEDKVKNIEVTGR